MQEEPCEQGCDEEQMRVFNWAMRPKAVLMLLLSLGSAPVLDAPTHGPGPLVAEADLAAWRAENGEVW